MVTDILCPGPAGEDEDDDLLRELKGMMEPELEHQETELDQLELNMAKLSVHEEEDNRHLLEQLPPVPTGGMAPSPKQRVRRTEEQVHPKPLLA